MNNQKSGMLVPALVGGALAGVLSAIPISNCLCCIWIIGGAMLAAYLLAKDSPVALRAGDGAIVGIFTGIIAAAVQSFILIPLGPLLRESIQNMMKWLAEYAEDIPYDWESWMGGGTSVFWFFINLVFSAFFFSVLGALGGVIGISLFGKKATQKAQGASDASQSTGDRQP